MISFLFFVYLDVLNVKDYNIHEIFFIYPCDDDIDLKKLISQL